MGWKGESRRHSLSRKGIKTNIDKNKRLSVRNFVSRGSPKDSFATGKSLEAYLETAEGEAFIEEHFESLFEIPFNSVSEEEGIPYWIDNYENMVSGERIYQNEFDGELMESVYGYHDAYRIGQNRSINDKEYYYAGSQGSDSELELQADNGDLVYYSLGSNYFRIWKRFPKTYISQEEDGSFELIHNNKTVLETDSPASTIGSIPEFNEEKALKNMREYANIQHIKLGNNDWKLQPIIWDDYENKFIKGAN